MNETVITTFRAKVVERDGGKPPYIYIEEMEKETELYFEHLSFSLKGNPSYEEVQDFADLLNSKVKDINFNFK